MNSSNDYHGRTFELIQNIPAVNSYVHIDFHDDIAMGSSVKLPSTSLTSADFVEYILGRGHKVVFIGQGNLGSSVSFKGRRQILLLRNNLTRYLPIQNVFFWTATYLFCPRSSVDDTLPVIQSAIQAPGIRKI